MKTDLRSLFPLRPGAILNALILVLTLLALGTATRSHEVLPSIVDMTLVDGVLKFDVQANLEGFVAEIDLSRVDDIADTAEAATYDALRAMEPTDLEQRFRAFWPRIAEQIVIRTEHGDLKPELTDVEIAAVGNTDLVRPSVLRFRAAPPEGATSVQIGWAASLGVLVLRQQGVVEPYDGYLAGGTISPPIPLAGGGQASALQTFHDYVPIGFQHIVPLGLDHILFVLGLFLLAARLRPLFWQVTAFTLAHTVTLALGALGYVDMPGRIVEPIIAASIVYVAVENILTERLSRWRPAVVFGFGLLHGLGFASVLDEFGIPERNFVPALLGFNVGVELGQLAVILIAFLLLGWFRNKPWYRKIIAIPASGVIGMMGVWWFFERTLL